MTEWSPRTRAAGDGAAVQRPATFAQEWWRLMRPAGCVTLADNVPFAYRIRARLDRRVVARALGVLIQRHAALRTHVLSRGDAVVQVIRSDATPDVTHETIAAGGSDALAASLLAACREPIDSTLDVPIRAWLFSMSEDEHVLLFVVSHFVWDAHSLHVFERDLFALLASPHGASAARLPPLRTDLARFAEWQRAWVESAAGRRRRAFWTGHLQGLDPTLGIPLIAERSSVVETRQDHVPFSISPRGVSELRALASACNASRFMVLFAAVVALLRRVAFDREVVASITSANRHRLGARDVVGLLLNWIVFRAVVERRLTLRQLVARLQPVLLGAYAKSDVPIAQVARDLGRGLDLESRRTNPLWEVEVNYGVEGPVQLAGVAGIEVAREPIPVVMDTAPWDGALFILYLFDGGDSLSGSLRFNANVVERRMAEQLAADLVTLVEFALRDPDARL
ncbi:MAG TPA: condensation domain-containing protein [Actinomycetota bacterium]|nr:condensation domain-containing protein [Actinomycetota bacterium]